MSDNDIKPVAWTSELQLYLVREQGYGTMASDDRHWSIALYDQSAIDHLKAERDAAVADARRWNELCRQIDAGTFPSVVIEDAMEIGSGALELQVDASMAEGGE